MQQTPSHHACNNIAIVMVYVECILYIIIIYLSNAMHLYI